jgi:hypothetical protein
MNLAFVEEVELPRYLWGQPLKYKISLEATLKLGEADVGGMSLAH